MELHSQRIVVLVALSVLVSVSAETTCEFPAVFNFGDSNSDTGGWSAAFGQAGPPHGESFFQRPAGRYCDGRLIIDFIAENFGLPYLSAFLDSMGANFSHGANFATAASTIRPTDGVSPFALNVQHYQFDDFYRRSQFIGSQGGNFFEGLVPKTEDFSRALYTFDIGQNDLTVGYSHNMTVDQVKDFVPEVLDQFKTIIKGFYYYQGGRSFWIHNTGPVGCLAYIMDRFPITAAQIDKIGCATPFNEVAKFFNKKLKEVVVELREELTEAAITYVDVYSVKYDLFSNAKKHGFEHPLRACCGHGGKYNYNVNIGCGQKMMVKGKEVLIGKACEDPSKAIVWDGVHYTQAANKRIFEMIADGSYSDPPIPLKMACLRQ